MKNDLTLFVSTGSYPWDGAVEQTFLDLEIEVLRQHFARVVLVPEMTRGARLPTHPDVEVDESYATERARLGRRVLLAHALRTTLVPQDVLRRGAITMQRKPLRELIRHAGIAHHARDWAVRAVEARSLAPERAVFYTFWWTSVTTGFGLARSALPGIRVVTRAHGFDLYEDRHTPAYIPARERALEVVDAVFPDSDRGTAYLAPAATRTATRCETARLGVADPGLRCVASTDGVLRVVSCSLQVPVKRLDLLLDGIAELSRRRPGLRVEWTHFGTGNLEGPLTSRAAQTFSPNASVRFAGYATQRALFEWYGAHPVDVFVNVSASEGTPVSIIEAVACGIPVLATAVGGNPEVAEARNAHRLSPTPTPSEVADGLERFAPGGPGLEAMRAASREVWANRFDAPTNYAAFVELVVSARRGRVEH